MVHGIRGDDEARLEWLHIFTEMHRVVKPTRGRHTIYSPAFEGLVGSHGGLGGWQDRGLFLAPSPLLDGVDLEIRGAEQLHHVLVSILVRLGHRSDLQRPVGMAHQ